MTRGSALTWSSVPFGQHRAFVQHRHLDAERAHERHVVLDDDDRMVAGDLAQQFARSPRSRRRSCRRPARRPAAASGPAPAACRSRAIASGRATARPRADARDRQAGWCRASRRSALASSASRRAEQRGAARARSPSAPAGGCPRPCGSRTPSASGTCGRCRARRSSASSSLVRSMRAVEQTVALVGPRLAGDDVHHGRLAGAVGADDGAHLARRRAPATGCCSARKPSKETLTPSR